MDEQEQRIEVHAYFVRFKSECYYALIVGKKSEEQQWFAKYADASTFLNTQKMREQNVRNARGNRLIGNETVIIDLQFCCYYGITAKRKEF